MLIRKPSDIPSSEITPKEQYLNRRKFLTAGGAAVGALALSSEADAMKLSGVVKSSYTVNEKVTPMDDATHYNNYYEFGTGKEEPARYASTLITSGWKVQIGGMVAKPQTLDLDQIM